VGVEKFDFHHRKIFALINNLREIIEKNIEEETKQVLEELKNYSQYHLEKEEEMLEKFSYPELSEHKKFHAFYNKKINDFLKDKDNLDLNQILEFLENWWTEHILQEDKKYSEFFADKNI
jgi:hemerythrin-like metal-binding protein